MKLNKHANQFYNLLKQRNSRRKGMLKRVELFNCKTVHEINSDLKHTKNKRKNMVTVATKLLNFRTNIN